MGFSSTEAHELVRLAQKRRLTLAVGYNKRLYRTYAKAREATQESGLGRIVQAHATCFGPGPYVGWIPSSDWFFEERGGGVLYDLTTHMVDTISFVLSDNIKEVATQSTTSKKDLGIVDNVTVLFKTESGVIGTISSGWGLGASNEFLEIVGTGGSVLATPFGYKSFHGKRNPMEAMGSPFGFLKGLLLTRSGNMNPLDGMDETYVREDRVFMDSISGNGKPFATGLDALRVLETIEAIKSSLGGGEFVRIRRHKV